MCFDPGALLNWLRRARLAGITLPLRLGLAAPLKTRKLIELSLRNVLLALGDTEPNATQPTRRGRSEPDRTGPSP